MKRLVLLVEGEGEVKAIPALVGRLLTQLPDDLQGQLFPDDPPMKVGGIHQITGNRQGDLTRHLRNANNRPKLGAVLLALDGDADRIEGRPFCAAEAARAIAQRATAAGAGVNFSFAVVFLRQEYESLLIPVATQFSALKPGVSLPTNVEEAPRDAKGWLDANLVGGYQPTENQLELTRGVQDWTPARALRCFRRLEHALTELTAAVAGGRHIVSPLSPADPTAAES